MRLLKVGLILLIVSGVMSCRHAAVEPSNLDAFELATAVQPYREVIVDSVFVEKNNERGETSNVYILSHAIFEDGQRTEELRYPTSHSGNSYWEVKLGSNKIGSRTRSNRIFSELVRGKTRVFIRLMEADKPEPINNHDFLGDATIILTPSNNGVFHEAEARRDAVVEHVAGYKGEVIRFTGSGGDYVVRFSIPSHYSN